MKSLLGLGDLDMADIQRLIDRGVQLHSAIDVKTRIDPKLAGVTVANLFFEPSTRTQLSFDLAAQRLGANVLNFNEAGSSTSKGETLRDTVETVAAVGAEVLVVRHRETGAQREVARWTSRAVVNAGEGAVSHPTQALGDAVTLIRERGSIDGLRIGIVGDIIHSRVASSLSCLLPNLGANLVQIAPPQFLNRDLGIASTSDFDSVIADLDVVYLLRVQTERGAHITSDYIDRYQLNLKRRAEMSPRSLVMHAGPVNRDVEIESSVLDDPGSLVLQQVASGVPTRMAVLEWVITG